MYKKRQVGYRALGYREREELEDSFDRGNEG